MGTNLLMLLPGSTSAGGARGGFGSQPTLTWDDLKAIQTEVPTVRYAAPYLRSTSQVLSEDQNWTTQVGGTTPDYFEIRDWPMADGRGFTDSDVDAGTKVVILGRDGGGEALRAQRQPGRAGGPDPEHPLPGGRRRRDARDSPRRGRTTTTRSSSPGRRSSPRSRAGCGKFINGSIFVSATNADHRSRSR